MLVTIGAFDGFHKGHDELLKVCRSNAINNNWGVITFWPHPGVFLKKVDAPLFNIPERELIAKVLGIPNIFIIEFNDKLQNLKPEEFWIMIRNKFNIDGLAIGKDFRFGINCSGDANYLSDLAKADGINKIFILDLYEKNIYSSSNARKNIISGNVKKVNEILGYPFFMISDVITGNQRGRTINFPTANLNISGLRTIPPAGVYSAGVLINNSWYCGAVSIGNNPTFGDIKELRCEVFILNFNGNIYGDEIAVFFLDKVRDLIKFDDVNKLAVQINKDIKICEDIYKNEFNRFALSHKFQRAFTER